jgi:hypothetical protein
VADEDAHNDAKVKRSPHPFFWAFLTVVVAGVLGASLAADDEPVWALHSAWVYRAEVGLALAAAVYVLVIAGWLAWSGRTFRRLELPGGTAFEAPPLDQAANGVDEVAREFDDYRAQNDELVKRLGSALDKLNERVERLEGR